MDKRINLTEEDIQYNYETDELCIVCLEPKNYKQLKQQILENQEIIHELAKFCNLMNIAEESETEFLKHTDHVHAASLTIQDIIKKTTGKDIEYFLEPHEIQNQETV